MYKVFLRFFIRTSLFTPLAILGFSVSIFLPKFVYATDSAPVISSITPSVVHYYDEAEITGTGFGNDRTKGGVDWAGTGDAGYSLAVDSWTDTTIRIRINNEFPGNPHGSHGITVRVENGKGGYYQSNSFIVNVEKALCDPKNWSCGDWSACTAAGQQTRSCNKAIICEGAITSPPTIQNCTYVAPNCTSWVYSNWSACSLAGQQTRSILSSNPLGCTGGNPILQQSCTLTCSADTWFCNDWLSCSAFGTQTRTCAKTFDCSTVSTPSPETSQSCTPPLKPSPIPTPTPQPTCYSDTWACADWGSCLPQGVQKRSCRKTFDCSSAETPAPATEQSCDAPVSTATRPAQDSGDSVNREQIFKATVKLLCPMPDKKTAMQGSGTVIDQYGTILTNRHVVLGTIGSCHVGFISSEDDTPSYDEIADVKNISYDTSPNGDMAVLKIRNPNGKQFVAVDISNGNNNTLKSGVDTILPFGYPDSDLFGETITPTNGKYVGRATTLKVCGASLNISGYFKTSATIYHGSSGGGAYQEKTGNFMGMPTLGTSCVKDVPSLVSYILSVNTIKKWLWSIGGSYSVMNNNYSNIENYFSSPVAIEEMTLSNLQALDASAPTVSIYNDKTKRVLLTDENGWFGSRTPTFLINGEQSQLGYYVYFGVDKKANPVKKGIFIRTAEYSPALIKRNGNYYFIFRVKDSSGNVSDAVITEYRYKK